MAIGYARAEFVKRSSGKNACAKAAYNARTRVEFDGNCSLDPEVYDWSSKPLPAFHEVLLPFGTHEKFKNPQVLWNAAEAREKRLNSQVALEVLLALPDDKVISLEDRIYLTKTFIQTHFVDKGLAAQIDIHSPERKIQITRDNKEIGLSEGMAGNVEELENLFAVQLDNGKTVSFNPQEFTGFVERESNWHAHVLVTTRRFLNDGSDLGEKCRDLMPRIAKGKVISGPDWGKLWTDHQNAFFKEKGLNLRVDIPGIEPQEHLGPYRMRARSALDRLLERDRILEENAMKSRDVSCVLNKITERLSVFSKEDVERFLKKHVSPELHAEFHASFWKQAELVPLVNTKIGELSGKFSSLSVVEEEKRIVRLADSIHNKKALKVKLNGREQAISLNDEQREAFDKILNGARLSCINGYAGTGKSHLLVALKDVYVASGYQVRAFGPDRATADVLKKKGFQKAVTVHHFLFVLHNSRREIPRGKEVWILDEAGKLGSEPLLEFLKEAAKRNVQVVLSGDYAQLSSVGRGGMFKVFCERYGSHLLQQIQRQKQDFQREIAKDLAIGELGSAIDKLSSGLGIRWSSTKKEAMEQLISCWAKDKKLYPQASSLIIAHTNDEVRVLNEMVRMVRGQRGELSEKEFLCETSLGKVYVGVGDLIEFRKNEKEIGVTNGLAGVLIEANTKQFVVSIREDHKKPRTVVFNPQEYSAYQLGYASTYFRSQGQTINRAYVLHSPALNKRMFYVGLTRHVDDAYYFISKDQAYCLSDLKRQAMRDELKENTLGFTTLDEVQAQLGLEKKRQEVLDLKESDSFLDRVRGYGLAAYDIVKTKALAIGEHVQDRSPSKKFFNPEVAESNIKAAVVEIQAEKELPNPEKILKEVITQEKKLESTQVKLPGKNHIEEAARFGNPEEFFKNRQEKNQAFWESFTSEKQLSLNKYFSIAAEASGLRSVVDLQEAGSSQKSENASYFNEWQEACGKRNESAFDLTREMSVGELSAFLGKKTAGFIQEQASRHEAYILKREDPTALNLEKGLRDNIEPLLFSLFPEGPSRKERGSFRFGEKGSLSVVCAGEKTGQFYDFENQEGGGVFKLIQRELGLGGIEAREWAKGFLGIAREIKVPKIYMKTSSSEHKERDSEWVSLIPRPDHPAPKLEDLVNRKLHYYFEEVARHAYRNEGGQLLYYVLRLKDRNDPLKKITPPLSFGYWKSNPEKLCWELKGPAERNTIYNLSYLKERPLETVLIVEGEKTADLAAGKFPGQNFVCITWPGGAGAVRLADWAPLVSRKVVVWPDNDKAGLEAAESVCRELRRVGVSSLQMIDPVALQGHFPEKWDLADPLPSNAKDSLPKELLLSSLQKGIDPQQVLYRVASLDPSDPDAKARANEILWRVDERLRDGLEKLFVGQPWKVTEEILLQTSRILMGTEKRQGMIQYDSEISKRLCWQMAVYQAQHGKNPSDWEIKEMRNSIGALWNVVSKEGNDLAIDRVITNGCEKALSGKGVHKSEIQRQITREHHLIQHGRVHEEVLENMQNQKPPEIEFQK